MPYTTIKKPSDYFNAKIYTGTGSSNAVTGLNFQPDFTWIKQRSGVEQHVLFDAIRGVQKYIASNTTATESTTATTLTAFNSDGFTEGGHGMTGANGSTYASWNWKANGAGSSNTDGSITSTVSVNTTSGFSIVKYTGNDTAGATVGHGLGVKPSMIIFKALDWTGRWYTYHSTLGATKYMLLNATDISNTATSFMNNTEPTSSVFTLGTSGHVNDVSNIIAYCFADVQGYSKFGSYTGNGNADGTFVYTGFKPAFVMIKETNTAGTDWRMMDNKRSTFNLVDDRLFPNLNIAENTGDGYDFLSNGFKIRSSGGDFNGSGDTYIYMAFAEEPLVGDNPATAR